MRSDLVVLPEPNIDSDLGLPCVVEPFSVEDVIRSVRRSLKGVEQILRNVSLGKFP